MINYIKVKDHLLALNELPEVKGFIPKTWKFVSDNLVNKYDEELFEKAIEGRIQDIFDELISAPTGLSLNRKKIPQFIGIIVLILDELEFYGDSTKWKRYLEFRLKAFSLFIKNDFDVEAANLYINLKLIKKDLDKKDKIILKRVEIQLRLYSKSIDKKLKYYTNKNEYNHVKFLNSIYSFQPDYVFDQFLSEKERSHLKIPLIRNFLDVIIALVCTISIYAINNLLIKNRDLNISSFFLKGNINIIEFIVGLFCVYLIFLSFKFVEHSSLRKIYKQILKGSIIVSSFIFLQLYISYKYYNRIDHFFPKEVNKTNQDAKLSLLLIEFSPLKQTSIFAENYSEINISQLFYKKLLSINKNNPVIYNDEMIIDYYPYNYRILNQNDFNRLLDQEKYDFIVDGDVVDNNGEIFIFNSCYIPDTTFRNILIDWRIKYFETSFEGKINLLNKFVTYYSNPIDYYKTIFISNDDVEPILLCDIGCLPGMRYDIQNKFPNDLTFISSIEKSPIIVYYYISMMKNWSEYEKIKANKNNSIELKKKIDSILNILNAIISTCNDKAVISQDKNNFELYIHLILLEAYFINEKITSEFHLTNKLNLEIQKLWFQKTELIGNALEKIAIYNHLNEFDLDYLMASYWFSNYNLMATFLGLLSVNENPFISEGPIYVSEENSTEENQNENPFVNEKAVKKEMPTLFEVESNRHVLNKLHYYILKYDSLGLENDTLGRSDISNVFFSDLFREMYNHINNYNKAK